MTVSQRMVYLFLKKCTVFKKTQTFFDTKTCIIDEGFLRQLTIWTTDSDIEFFSSGRLKDFFFKDYSGWLMCNMFCMQVVLK